MYAEILNCVDDPHAFATAFAVYVDTTGDRDVTAAVQRWIAAGAL